MTASNTDLCSQWNNNGLQAAVSLNTSTLSSGFAVFASMQNLGFANLFGEDFLNSSQ